MQGNACQIPNRSLILLHVALTTPSQSKSRRQRLRRRPAPPPQNRQPNTSRRRQHHNSPLRPPYFLMAARRKQAAKRRATRFRRGRPPSPFRQCAHFDTLNASKMRPARMPLDGETTLNGNMTRKLELTCAMRLLSTK